ncbi:metallophosphoesterase [Moorellaceae bacterium AZ2]|uniref:metallophosphoesterase n=1 Tax=Thermanaeromonas sp. C210 TaxID=2731925 RepID=UPI00155C0BAE|nr:metallophosphoesterase [Thermanaeromonas sp. C210]GFN23937.1 metallophosphoesterase [Thermanaeromonas sp. C210]
MALFALGDLHLGRDMSLFGPEWDHHEHRIVEEWKKAVRPQDTVYLLGDLSWAMRLEEALPHLQLLKSLPGRKRILKGNHDYWWQTERKMRAAILDADFDLLKPEVVEGLAICGTRGWLVPGHPLFNPETDERVYRRETLRLERALQELARIRQGTEPIIVMLHFPPALTGEPSAFVDLMREYGVQRCYYAHLHGQDRLRALEGNHWGMEFHLVSGDHLAFRPAQLN